jgi:hypothetical protein
LSSPGRLARAFVSGTMGVWWSALRRALSQLHERLATGAGENCEHQHAVLLLVTQGQERIGARCAPRRYERRAHRDGHECASNDRERQRVTRRDAVE